jgi:hypothetical protein
MLQLVRLEGLCIMREVVVAVVTMMVVAVVWWPCVLLILPDDLSVALLVWCVFRRMGAG